MGQPRTSRRRVVTVSSDEDDEDGVTPRPDPDEKNDGETLAPVEGTGRATGKLKSVRTTRKTQQPTPAATSQEVKSQQSPGRKKTSRASTPGRPKKKENEYFDLGKVGRYAHTFAMSTRKCTNG